MGVVVTLYFSAIHNEMLRFINYLIIIAVFVTIGGGLFVIFVEDLEHSEQWESPQWCLRCIAGQLLLFYSLFIIAGKI